MKTSELQLDSVTAPLLVNHINAYAALRLIQEDYTPIMHKECSKTCQTLSDQTTCGELSRKPRFKMQGANWFVKDRRKMAGWCNFHPPFSHGKPLAWDMTVPDTFSQSYITATAANAGVAADKAASSKTNKYASWAILTDSSLLLWKQEVKGFQR